MSPFLKFLNAARSLQKTQGLSKADILNFAKNEFGEITGLMRAQIDNLFKPSKPIKPKDPDFDDTVIKLPIDDQGLPFNPRNPLKKAEGGIMRVGLVSGGRIGFKLGTDELRQMSKEMFGKDDLRLLTPDEMELLRDEFEIKKGRVEEASVDEPFFRDDYLDENAQMMFKKQYKDLTPDELEEFREEMMRLMNKFSSAPDPMDERNTVMENIAIDQFGKPLKDLSEEEIIQIEEMMDEMSIKKDRGAPSIKLAAEGGIMRVGLKDGVFKRGLKAIKDSDTIKTTIKTLEDRGYNTAVGLNLAFDEVFNILSGLPGLAEGGRIGYKDGPPDPTKRKFMKAAVGLASVLPFGIGKGVKMAAPVVTKAAELTGPALAKIVETVMDFGKLISVKGRRVKEMVTKKKHKGVEVEEDIADGSYIIKKDNKEIYYKPGRMDETGGVEDDIIEILEDTVTKKAGGGIARMLGE
jgi:hypothetical protein